MNTKIRELGDIELDAVSGGLMWFAVREPTPSKGDGGTSGGNLAIQQMLQSYYQPD